MLSRPPRTRVAFVFLMPKMLPRWLSSLCAGWYAPANSICEDVSALPADILSLFEGGKAAELKGSIKEKFESTKDCQPYIERLVDQAILSGWSRDEIEKIRIYGDYFSGQTAAAYQKIIADGYQETDFDLFAIACMALYLNDDFELAHTLLKTRAIDDPEFLNHPDFLGFAGYIALSSGAGVENSLRYFDMALKMGTVTTSYVTNAYPVYFEAGQHQVVADMRRCIQETFSHDPQTLFALACVELAKGYYPEGFRLAEARYMHPDAAQFINGDLFDKPRWRGESLAGKRLLVHAEQGLGDLIMCVRYLPLVIEKGAKVLLECNEVALPLLAPNFTEVEFLPVHRKTAVLKGFDYWIGAMSFPHLMNSTADSIPGKKSYLQCPVEHLQHWRARLQSIGSDKRPRIGIAWSGNPRHRADRRRSLSFELLCRYINAQRGVDFFSLQTDVPESCPDNLKNFSEELITLADTAGLIMEMDLVITVDTSVVHIAGALGKPVWLLLPHRYDWRWGLEGEKNAWYDSVLVLRQPNFENWTAVLEDAFCHRLPHFLEIITRNKA